MSASDEQPALSTTAITRILYQSDSHIFLLRLATADGGQEIALRSKLYETYHIMFECTRGCWYLNLGIYEHDYEIASK